MNTNMSKKRKDKMRGEISQELPPKEYPILSTRWKKYRIIEDKYLGFEVQVWRIWFPIWTEFSLGTNTHPTFDAAYEFAEFHNNRRNPRYI